MSKSSGVFPESDWSDKLMLEALTAIHANQLDRAHRSLQMIVRREPDNFEAWLLLGWTAPNSLAAVGYFQRALGVNPTSAIAKDGLAQAKKESARAQAEIARVATGGQPRNALTISRERGTPRVLTPRESGAPVSPSPANSVEAEAANEPTLAEAYPPSLPLLRTWKKIPAQPLWRNKNFIIPLIYLIALTAAESLTVLIVPQIGLVLHGLLLIALIVHASLATRGPQQRLLWSLTLAPLIRLLSLSLPLARIEIVYWYLIIGVPLLASTYVAARSAGYTAAKVGLTARAWPWQLLISLTGIGLGYTEYVILRPEPLVTSLTLDQIWFPALVLFIFTGFLEEIIFRGVMQRAATESLGRLGVLYVSIVFAVLHLGYQSVLDVVFVFLVAMFFGFIVTRTRSILGVTIAHGLTNIGLFIFFPLVLGR